MKFKKNAIKWCSVYFLTLSSFLSTSAVWSEATDIEPEADQILKNMSEYLAGIEKFTVTSHSTIESIWDSGQKIMLDHYNTVSVERPNKLFAQRAGDVVDQSFYYNGQTFTQYDFKKNQYKTIDAPNNLSDALDYSFKQLEILAPGADLIYKNSYERLSNQLLSGFYVDKTIIDGVECHHLAFRNTEVDWQIWIETGDKPLPKRYVVTSRWTTGSPQFVLDMNWNTKPDFSDNIFNFTAPDKAVKK